MDEPRSVRFLGLLRVLLRHKKTPEIESKEQADREKDRTVLPVLRQTLAMKARLGKDERP